MDPTKDVRTLNTLLVTAASEGDLEEVKRLLNQGANFHSCEGTALIHTAWHGQLRVLSYLLSLGVDIGNCEYALSAAADRGHLHIVKYMHTTSKKKLNYDRALTYAIEEARLSVAMYLAPLVTDASSGLNSAVKNNHPELASFFQDMYPKKIDCSDPDSQKDCTEKSTLLPVSDQWGPSLSSLLQKYY